ncbi:hypothetical protein [Arthrobacter sp. A2-55]|uniref:hypothetical protein n=1 Tax=Arthrobacter sp. A2-55 TaxID=2897337 RepID=UPI0021CD219F|nr:hypothetical protein [Arthrobacter sp. A2-55]MCU6480523.1 hypothetical protein [Arthrobacter sp. A2-55]
MTKKTSAKPFPQSNSVTKAIRRRFDRRNIGAATLIFTVLPIVALLAGGLSILSDNHNGPLLEAANAASSTIMSSSVDELEKLPLAAVENLRNNALWGKSHLSADRAKAIPAFEKIDAIFIAKNKE